MSGATTRRELTVGVLLAALAAGGLALAGSALPVVAASALPSIASAGAGALGLVLMYRTNGVLNLAQIQLAAFAATAFACLTGGSKLLIATHNLCECLTFVPTDTQRLVNMAIAAVLTLAVCAIAWWALHVLISGRLGASPLLGTVATGFVAVGLAALGPMLRDNLVDATDLGQGRALDSWPVPLAGGLSLAGITTPWWSLITLALLAAAFVWIALALATTLWGRSLRAVADHPARAQSLGISALAVGGRSWLISGALAALAGIGTVMARPALPAAVDTSAIAASVQVTPLVIALAAAAIAAFTQIWLAGLSAVILGFFSYALTSVAGTSAPSDALMVLIVALPMLAGGARRRATRSRAGSALAVADYRPIPPELNAIEAVSRWRTFSRIIPAIAIMAIPLLATPGTSLRLAGVATFALVAISCLAHTALTGQAALGQIGYATAGAWLALATGLPILPGLIGGALIGAGLALAVTAPTLRLAPMQLAVISLIFAAGAQALFRDPLLAGALIQGEVANTTLAGVRLADGRLLYLVTVALVALGALAYRNLRRSRTGRALIALRDNPVAAQAMGINPTRTTLAAAAFAGALAGGAGAWLGYAQGSMAGAFFTAENSLTVFLFTVIGGLGGLAGVIVATLMYAITQLAGGTYQLVALAIAGWGGVGLLLIAPRGIATMFLDARDHILTRLAFRYRIAVPSLMGDGGIAALAGKIPLDDKRAPLTGTNDEPIARYALDFREDRR